jgi:hypothetical protein
MTSTGYFRARETFIAAMPDGVPPLTVNAGKIIAAGDPILLGREPLFEEIDEAAARDAQTRIHRAAPVEQATAAPGERRPTRRTTTDG